MGGFGGFCAAHAWQQHGYAKVVDNISNMLFSSAAHALLQKASLFNISILLSLSLPALFPLLPHAFCAFLGRQAGNFQQPYSTKNASTACRLPPKRTLSYTPVNIWRGSGWGWGPGGMARPGGRSQWWSFWTGSWQAAGSSQQPLFLPHTFPLLPHPMCSSILPSLFPLSSLSSYLPFLLVFCAATI